MTKPSPTAANDNRPSHHATPILDAVTSGRIIPNRAEALNAAAALILFSELVAESERGALQSSWLDPYAADDPEVVDIQRGTGKADEDGFFQPDSRMIDDGERFRRHITQKSSAENGARTDGDCTSTPARHFPGSPVRVTCS